MLLRWIRLSAVRVFKDAGVRMAFSKPYYLKNGIDTVAESIEKNFKFPVVLKPACEGSTIGLEIVYEKEKLKEALKRVFAIESRIFGRSLFRWKGIYHSGPEW